MFKPQPDRVPDSKKAILGKKILEILNKKYIPESDIEIIINNIDWDELKKSCADFYVNFIRINHFKIFLKIIKKCTYYKLEITKNPIIHYSRKIIKKFFIYYNFKILVKYIHDIGLETEEKLELKHDIMDHSFRIAQSYLEIKKIPKSTTKEMIVMGQLVEEVERITYPKILLYLNTFTCCKLIERINSYKDYLGENIEEKRNLENFKKSVEEWFSENRYDIPGDNECLSSLNLLNTADSERRKTSEEVKKRTKQIERKKIEIKSLLNNDKKPYTKVKFIQFLYECYKIGKSPVFENVDGKQVEILIKEVYDKKQFVNFVSSNFTFKGRTFKSSTVKSALKNYLLSNKDEESLKKS